MIDELRILNFAIIDHCELKFANGLSIFTGETGAGKSIIIEALSLLLGKQANTDMIKSGQNEAVIEATFIFKNPDLFPLLKDFFDESNLLIVFRKISRTKENICRINNQTVSLKILKTIMTNTINIIGQHSHLELFNPENQLELLDQYSGNELSTIKQDYRDVLSKYKETSSKLQKLQTADSENERKKEFIRFQLNDIKEHKFDSQEDLKLEKTRKEIQNLSKTRNLLFEVTKNLSKIVELSDLSHTKSEKLAQINRNYLSISEELTAISLQSNEVLHELKNKSANLDQLSEQDIDQIESRLDLIFKYKTKYKVQNLEELLNLSYDLEKELNMLENYSENQTQLQSECLELKNKLNRLSQKMNHTRKSKSAKMAIAVQQKMENLNFPQGQFSIQIEHQPDNFNLNGQDKVTYLVSTNAGEPLKPLQKIASGGELSRIVLAINTILNKTLASETMIFDEVDTGVGGLTAITIGEYLKELAANHQLFCITHLPQIAKFAHNHFYIEKNFQNNNTQVTVKQLLQAETPAEIKRMIGGKHVLDAIQN